MGLRWGAAWDCGGALRGAAQECCLGLRMGCVKGCAWRGGRLITVYWRPPPYAEALTIRILEPWLQARFVASPQVVGLAGAQYGAALGRCLQLCMGTAWGGA